MKNLDIQTILDLPVEKKVKLIKAEEVAEFYGIHKNTFYEWRYKRPNVFRALLDWYLVFNEDKVKDEVEN